MAKKILVVDDEPDIRDSIRMFLKKEGYEIKTSNSGSKTFEILKKEKFDLILLDILMPKMSGREVLEKIREDPKLKNQKVAFLTVVKLGLVGKDSLKKLKPAGYFQKPIKIMDLRKGISKILG